MQLKKSFPFLSQQEGKMEFDSIKVHTNFRKNLLEVTLCNKDTELYKVSTGYLEDEVADFELRIGDLEGTFKFNVE